MKVYLAEFRLRDRVAYKIGHTKWFYPIKRFKTQNAIDGTYELQYEYKVFDNIKIIDDILIQDDNAIVARKYAKLVEACLLAVFPKNFVLEEHFGTRERLFDGLSGITEMFIIPEGADHYQRMIKTFRSVGRNVERIMNE